MSISILTPRYCGHGVFEPPTNLTTYLCKIIQARGPVTRDELVKLTGIPRTTLYDALIKLVLTDQIARYSKKSPRNCRGRPLVLFEGKS